MSETIIVENNEAVVVMSDDFQIGRGFVFPYGQIDHDTVLGIEWCSVSCEPENHEQARSRLSEISGRVFARQKVAVRLPRLRDITYVFGYIANLQDTNLSDKLISLLMRHSFFGFDINVLFPDRKILISNDENMYKRISRGDSPIEEVLERATKSVANFAHEPGGHPDRTSNYWMYSGRELNGPMTQLEKIIGKEGVLGVKRLLKRTSPVFIDDVSDLDEVAGKILPLPEYYNFIQVDHVQVSLSTDFAKKYSQNMIRGVPFIKLNSSKGTDPERGAMIYDEITIGFDFWGHEPSCEKHGYTFGIID